jgi:CNT family concentrative nucleoside transporter
LGLLVLIGFATLFSANRRHIDWKLVGVGILLQLIFGLLIMKVEVITTSFDRLSSVFVTFLSYSRNGAEFLFGGLVSNTESFGFLFAFQVLPTIIFFAAVSAGLYYLGILQKIVYVIAFIMARTMKLSGAESLSAAGNIFLGQTEAPLLVKPFIKSMTRSELMCLMTGGMATMAGGVLAGYVTFLGGSDPVEQAKYAAYLLSASIMNAPAAIVLAKIILPEQDKHLINTSLKVNNESLGVNFIDAISRGTVEEPCFYPLLPSSTLSTGFCRTLSEPIRGSTTGFGNRQEGFLMASHFSTSSANFSGRSHF